MALPTQKSSSEAFHVDWSRVEPQSEDDVFEIVLQLVQAGQRAYYEGELNRINPRPGLENVMKKFKLTRNEAFAIWALTLPAPRGSVDASPCTQLNYLLNTRAASERQNVQLLKFYYYLRSGIVKLPKRSPAKLYYGLSSSAAYNPLFKEGSIVYFPGVTIVREKASPLLDPTSGTATLVMLKKATSHDVSLVSRHAFEKQRVLLPNSSIKVNRSYTSDEAMDLLDLGDDSNEDEENEDEDGEGKGTEDEEKKKWTADLVMAECRKLTDTDADVYDPAAAIEAKKRKKAAEEELLRMQQSKSRFVDPFAENLMSTLASPDAAMLQEPKSTSSRPLVPSTAVMATIQLRLSDLVRTKIVQLNNGTASIRGVENMIKKLLQSGQWCAAYRLFAAAVAKASSEPNSKVIVWHDFLDRIVPLCHSLFDANTTVGDHLSNMELDGLLVHLFLDACSAKVNRTIVDVDNVDQDSWEEDACSKMCEDIAAADAALVAQHANDAKDVGGQTNPSPSLQPEKSTKSVAEMAMRPLIQYLKLVELIEDMKRAKVVVEAKQAAEKAAAQDTKTSRKQKETPNIHLELRREFVTTVQSRIRQLLASDASTVSVVSSCVIIPLGCRDEPRSAFGAAILTRSPNSEGKLRWIQVMGGSRFHAARVVSADGCCSSKIMTIDGVDPSVLLASTHILERCICYRLDEWPDAFGKPVKDGASLYERILGRLGGKVVTSSDLLLPNCFFQTSPQSATTQAVCVFSGVLQCLSCLMTHEKQLLEVSVAESAIARFETSWSVAMSKLYYHIGSTMQVRFWGLDDDHPLKVPFQQALAGVARYGAQRASTVLELMESSPQGKASIPPHDRDFALSMASLAWDASLIEVADAKKQLSQALELLKFPPIPSSYLQSEWVTTAAIRSLDRKSNTQGAQDSQGAAVKASTSAADGKLLRAPTIVKNIYDRGRLSFDQYLDSLINFLASSTVERDKQVDCFTIQKAVRFTLSVLDACHALVSDTHFMELLSNPAAASEFWKTTKADEYAKYTTDRLLKIKALVAHFYKYASGLMIIRQECSSIPDSATGAFVSWNDWTAHTLRFSVCYFFYLISISMAGAVDDAAGKFIQRSLPLPLGHMGEAFHSDYRITSIVQACKKLHGQFTSAATAQLHAFNMSNTSTRQPFIGFEFVTKAKLGEKQVIPVDDPHVELMTKEILTSDELSRKTREASDNGWDLGYALVGSKTVGGRETPFLVARDLAMHCWFSRTTCTHGVTNFADTARYRHCDKCLSDDNELLNYPPRSGPHLTGDDNPHHILFNVDPSAHADNQIVSEFRTSGSKTAWNLVQYTRVRSIRTEPALFVDRLAMAIINGDFALENPEQAVYLQDLLHEFRLACDPSSPNFSEFQISANQAGIDTIMDGICQACQEIRITDRKVGGLRNAVRCGALLLSFPQASVNEDHKRKLRSALQKARDEVGKYLMEDLSIGELRPHLILECCATILISLSNQSCGVLESQQNDSTSRYHFAALALRSRVLMEAIIRQFDAERYLPKWLFAEAIHSFSSVETELIDCVQNGKVFVCSSRDTAAGVWTGVQRILAARYPDQVDQFDTLCKRYPHKSVNRLYRSLLHGWKGQDPTSLLTPGEAILSFATGVGQVSDIDDAKNEEDDDREEDAMDDDATADKPKATKGKGNTAQKKSKKTAQQQPATEKETVPVLAWCYASDEQLFYYQNISFNPLTGVVESRNPHPDHLHKNKAFQRLCTEDASHPVLSHYQDGFIARHPFQPATHTYSDGHIVLRTDISSSAKREWTLYIYVRTSMEEATSDNPIFYERFVCDKEKERGSSHLRRSWERYLPVAPPQLAWLQSLAQGDPLLFFLSENGSIVFIKTLDRRVKFVYDITQRWVITAHQEFPWSPISLREIVFPFSRLEERLFPDLHRIFRSTGSLATVFGYASYKSIVSKQRSTAQVQRIAITSMDLGFTMEPDTGFLQCDHIGGGYLKVSQEVPALPHARNGLILVPRESKAENIEGVLNDDVVVFSCVNVLKRMNGDVRMPKNFVYRTSKESGSLTTNSTLSRIYLAHMFAETASHEHSGRAYREASEHLRRCERNVPLENTEYALLNVCFLLPGVPLPNFDDVLAAATDPTIDASSRITRTVVNVWRPFLETYLPDKSRSFSCLWLWAFFVLHRSLTLAPLFRSEPHIESAKLMCSRLKQTLLPIFLHQYCTNMWVMDAKCRLPDDVKDLLVALVVQALPPFDADVLKAVSSADMNWTESAALLWLFQTVTKHPSSPVATSQLSVAACDMTTSWSKFFMYGDFKEPFESLRNLLKIPDGDLVTIATRGTQPNAELTLCDHFFILYQEIMEWSATLPSYESANKEAVIILEWLLGNPLFQHDRFAPFATALVLISCALGVGRTRGVKGVPALPTEWQFNENGRWERFDATTEAAIEAQFQLWRTAVSDASRRALQNVTFRHRNFEYTLDLAGMTQSNNTTGKRRDVRRWQKIPEPKKAKRKVKPSREDGDEEMRNEPPPDKVSKKGGRPSKALPKKETIPEAEDADGDDDDAVDEGARSPIDLPRLAFENFVSAFPMTTAGNKQRTDKKLGALFHLNLSIASREACVREAFHSAYRGGSRVSHEDEDFDTFARNFLGHERRCKSNLPKMAESVDALIASFNLSHLHRSKQSIIVDAVVRVRIAVEWFEFQASLLSCIEAIGSDEEIVQLWTALVAQKSTVDKPPVVDVFPTGSRSGGDASINHAAPCHPKPGHPAHLDVLRQNADFLAQQKTTFETTMDRWFEPISQSAEAVPFPLTSPEASTSSGAEGMLAEYQTPFAAQFLDRLKESFKQYSSRNREALEMKVTIPQLNDFLKQYIVKCAELTSFAREGIENLLIFTPTEGAWRLRCELITQSRSRHGMPELLASLSCREPLPDDSASQDIKRLEDALKDARARSKAAMTEDEEEAAIQEISRVRKLLQAAKDAASSQVSNFSEQTRRRALSELNPLLDDDGIAVLDRLVVGYLDVATASQQARRALHILMQIKSSLQKAIANGDAPAVMDPSSDPSKSKEGNPPQTSGFGDDALSLLFQDLGAALKIRSHPMCDTWALYRIFELESNIRIRPYQFELCQRLVENARKVDGNAVMYQLFMGDGKTTVVLPLLSAILCSRADSLLTVTVPEALVASTVQVLRQRFDSSIPKQILQLPFNRTLPPSMVELAETLQNILAELQHAVKQRFILVQSPEHRLCFELRYYEVLLECLEIDAAGENAPLNPRSVAEESHASLSTLELLFAKFRELGYLLEDGLVQDTLPHSINVFYEAVEGHRFPANVVTMLFHKLSRRALSHCVAVRRCRELFEQLHGIPKTYILDESDDILRYGSELHYSVGSKEPLHQGRFEAAYMLTKLVLHDSETLAFLKASSADAADATSSLVIQENKDIESLAVPVIRWGAGDAPHVHFQDGSKPLAEYLARRLVNQLDGELSGLAGGAKGDTSRLDSITDFLIGKSETLPSTIVSRRTLLFTARGWLACGILDHVFSKRHRVEFGIDHKKHGGCGVAVPFRGSEVASDRAQFAHPDVLIGFTFVSYFYQGLNLKQTKALLRVALDTQRSLLRRWLKESISLLQIREKQLLSGGASELPEYIHAAIDRYDANGDLPDLHDSNDVRYAHVLLRHHVDAIWCYLSNVLLPLETMQYPEKISGNGCHIAAPPHTVGFSGTDDTRSTMPHRVQCVPFEATIHGKMLHIAARAKNATVVPVTYNTVHEYLLQVVQMVHQARKSETPIHVMIDAGAVCCGMTNRQVVRYLMARVEMQNLFEGCIYCDDDTGQLVVFMHATRSLGLLSTSQVSPSRLFCFLDDVHTRGIDVKFPAKATGIVTIGDGMEKDKFMQAIMRLRQLDNGQRFVVHLQAALAKTIAALNHVDLPELTTSHVLRWVTWNTMTRLRRDFPSAIVQNIQHITHEIALQFQRRSSSAIAPLVSRLKSDVKHDAEALYSGKRTMRYALHYLQERRQKLCNPLWADITTKLPKDAFVIPGETFDAFVASRLKHCNTLLDALDGRTKGLLEPTDMILVSDGPQATEEQEQECQVEVEIEQVREEVKYDSIRHAQPLPPHSCVNKQAVASLAQIHIEIEKQNLIHSNRALLRMGLKDMLPMRLPRRLLFSRDVCESVATTDDLAFYAKCLDYLLLVKYKSSIEGHVHNAFALAVSSNEVAELMKNFATAADPSLPTGNLEICVLLKLDAFVQKCPFGIRTLFEAPDTSSNVMASLFETMTDCLAAVKLLWGECHRFSPDELDMLQHQMLTMRASDLQYFESVYCVEERDANTNHMRGKVASLLESAESNEDIASSTTAADESASSSTEPSTVLGRLLIAAAKSGLCTESGRMLPSITDGIEADGTLRPREFISLTRLSFNQKAIDDFISVLEWYIFSAPALIVLEAHPSKTAAAGGTPQPSNKLMPLLHAERDVCLRGILNLPSALRSFICTLRGKHEEYRGSILEKTFTVE